MYLLWLWVGLFWSGNLCFHPTVFFFWGHLFQVLEDYNIHQIVVLSGCSRHAYLILWCLSAVVAWGFQKNPSVPWSLSCLAVPLRSILGPFWMFYHGPMLLKSTYSMNCPDLCCFPLAYHKLYFVFISKWGNYAAKCIHINHTSPHMHDWYPRSTVSLIKYHRLLAIHCSSHHLEHRKSYGILEIKLYWWLLLTSRPLGHSRKYYGVLKMASVLALSCR